ARKNKNKRNILLYMNTFRSQLIAYSNGIILVIIAIIIVGLIERKRVYDVVERQESWKLDIMDRDIAVQLGQIKELNLSGETQEKFESWKERWETIVTKESSDIEEVLFDAEEARSEEHTSELQSRFDIVC